MNVTCGVGHAGQAAFRSVPGSVQGPTLPLLLSMVTTHGPIEGAGMAGIPKYIAAQFISGMSKLSTGRPDAPVVTASTSALLPVG
jgi:hypothetical protein